MKIEYTEHFSLYSVCFSSHIPFQFISHSFKVKSECTQNLYCIVYVAAVRYLFRLFLTHLKTKMSIHNIFLCTVYASPVRYLFSLFATTTYQKKTRVQNKCFCILLVHGKLFCGFAHCIHITGTHNLFTIHNIDCTIIYLINYYSCFPKFL